MTCNEVIAAYVAGLLQSGFACLTEPSGRLCVVTPYLYPDHDNIEVFVRDKVNRVVVSDLGETLRRMDNVGMDVPGTPNLLFQAKRIAGGFDVLVQEGILFKEGTPSEVGKILFDVIAASSAVASLIYRSRAYEPANFEDEVIDYLRDNGITVEERNVSLTGMSGTRYRVSMRVPTRRRGAVLVGALSPKTSKAARPVVNQAFRQWADINSDYADPATKLSILNDEAISFREEDLRLLRRVSEIHKWTERQAFLSALK
jgi:hypothetical protein